MDELVTYFIVACNDKSTIIASKCMMYGEGLGKTVTFFLEVEGGEVVAGTQKKMRFHA